MKLVLKVPFIPSLTRKRNIYNTLTIVAIFNQCHFYVLVCKTFFQSEAFQLRLSKKTGNNKENRACHSAKTVGQTDSFSSSWGSGHIHSCCFGFHGWRVFRDCLGRLCLAWRGGGFEFFFVVTQFTVTALQSAVRSSNCDVFTKGAVCCTVGLVGTTFSVDQYTCLAFVDKHRTGRSGLVRAFLLCLIHVTLCKTFRRIIWGFTQPTLQAVHWKKNCRNFNQSII